MKRLRVLAESARLFAEAGSDPRALLDVIVQRTARVLDAGALVLLVERDGVTASRRASFDADPELDALLRALEKPTRLDMSTLTGRVVLTGETVFVPDTADERGRAAFSPHTAAIVQRLRMGSLLAAPLRARGRSLGALIVYRRVGAARLDDDDARFAQGMADHAALAIANAQLLEDALAAVAAQKRAERILERASASLALVEGVVAATRHPFLVLDHAMTVLLANPAFLRVFRAEDAEVVGRPLGAIAGGALGGGDVARALASVSAEGAEIVDLPLDVDVPGVGRRSLLLDARKTGASEHGETILLAIEDVTERALGEKKLRETNVFLDAVVENLPSMLFVKDAERLAFTRLNRAAEALLGMSRTEMLGKTDFDFFPEEEARFFQAKDRETLAKGEVVEVGEEPITTAAGTRWLHTRKITIPDEDGAPAYLLGISLDVTTRKEAEDALREAKVQLEATNRELEAFSWSVSHDLRAPLRAMDGFAGALEEDYGAALDDTARSYLARVRAAARRMGVLIDDLIRLSRISRVTMERRRVDLSALARDVVAELRAREPERRVEVTVADGLVAFGDVRLLRVALENLVGNAWKFTSKREDAHIDVGRDDRGFFVRDDGAGFDAAFRDKLFGAFQRLHTADEYPGTGIGLATVQRIVGRHGGRVWAEGEPGRGATFHFVVDDRGGAE